MATDLLGIKPGRILFIKEVLDPNITKDGDAVRVFGKIKSFDVATATAIIEYKNDTLPVDVSLFDASYSVNTLFQFIGEVERQNNKVLLKARVARNIDGLDLNLFEKSLKIRRQFEADMPKA